MSVRPHRLMKLDAEGKAVAAQLLGLLGFHRTAKHPLSYWGGWLGLPAGLLLLVLSIYGAATGADWTIPAFGGTGVLLVLAFLGISRGKGGTWFAGHGQRFRMEWATKDGETLVRILDESGAHGLSETSLPAPSPAPEAGGKSGKTAKPPRPWLYADLAPFVASATAAVSGRDLVGTVPPRRESELRGLVLLGEVTRWLAGNGATAWRKNKSGLSASAGLSTFAVLLQSGGLVAGKVGGAVALALFLLMLPVIVVLYLRQALWCDLAPGLALRIADGIEADTYTVRFTGPGGEHAAVIHAGGILAGGLAPLDLARLSDALAEPFAAAMTAPEA